MPISVSADALRDELLNGEIFYTLREAQIVIEDAKHRMLRIADAAAPHLDQDQDARAN
jgi:hypothetical protein